jgi:hypothetical protein
MGVNFSKKTVDRASGRGKIIKARFYGDFWKGDAMSARASQSAFLAVPACILLIPCRCGRINDEYMDRGLWPQPQLSPRRARRKGCNALKKKELCKLLWKNVHEEQEVEGL